MSGSDDGWEWFPSGTRAASSSSGDAPEDPALAFARCFSTPDGSRVLAHLTEMTLGRALSPRVTDAELRYLEGQRQLVVQIRSLVCRGSGAATPAPVLHDLSIFSD